MLRAAAEGDFDRARALIDQGADVNARKPFADSTCLHYAAGRKNIGMVEYLLGKGANLEAADYLGMTPLTVAAYGGHEDVVKVLLKAGASVNRGFALHYACEAGHLGVVKVLLLSRKVDVDNRDKRGRTPLEIAVTRGEVGVVEALVASGGDVNRKDQEGDTLLHLAAREGHIPVIKLLIGKSPKTALLTRGDLGALPVHEALLHGKLDAVGLLISSGSRVGVPMTDAVMRKDLPLVERIAKSDASLIKSTDSYQCTPLHWAAGMGYLEIAKFLLANGANVEARDKRGSRPFSYASDNGHVALFREVLDKMPRLGDEDPETVHALRQAIRANNGTILGLLLGKGASASRPDENGETPLHHAVGLGGIEATKVLLANGAPPNPQDREGATPLHKAVRYGFKEIVELLVANGADIEKLRDNDGETPMDLAVKGKQVEIRKILEQATETRRQGRIRPTID